LNDFAVTTFVLFGALAANAAECPVLLEQARQAYESREFEKAIGAFGRAREACPRPEQALLPLAQAELMAQRFEASLATLGDLLRAEPGNTDALKLQGDVLYLLGRDAEAERALAAALEIDPRHEASRYALGRIYYQQNRLGEATAAFLQLVEENPSNYRAHDNLAVCYAAQQRDDEALRHFKKALDLVHKDHPAYDAVYANAAEFFLERGDDEKAFQFAAEAAERNPLPARNFFLAGKALARLEKPELSIRWLEQAAELDPAYREPLYWLFQVYRKLGRTDDAERAIAKFKELSETAPPRR
jgi:tetratricopeptide (TPR) repeat protein